MLPKREVEPDSVFPHRLDSLAELDKGPASGSRDVEDVPGMYDCVHPVLHGRVDDLRKGVVDVLLPLLKVELRIPEVGV